MRNESKPTALVSAFSVYNQRKKEYSEESNQKEEIVKTRKYRERTFKNNAYKGKRKMKNYCPKKSKKIKFEIQDIEDEVLSDEKEPEEDLSSQVMKLLIEDEKKMKRLKKQSTANKDLTNEVGNIFDQGKDEKKIKRLKKQSTPDNVLNYEKEKISDQGTDEKQMKWLKQQSTADKDLNYEEENISDQGTNEKKIKKLKKQSTADEDSNDKKENICDQGTENQDSTLQTSDKYFPKKCDNACGNIVAERCFKCMIEPLSTKRFFQEYWEKRFVHIVKKDSTYWNDLFSCEEFDNLLRKNKLEFSKHIDVTQYVNGKRQTVEAEGIANPTAVWSFYKDNCTIRLKNPQTYHEKVFEFLSHLQEYFGSFMGANMYLTPPGSQGFAPHYDDIEAFVLQIEGTKLWKIYAPRTKEEKLPRLSSRNFSEDEIGQPIFEKELQPGDTLYFPRGFIHQAKTVNDSHSLHLTISTYQKNTYGDLMEVMLPQALNTAMKYDLEFRKSLPVHYLDHLGFANEDVVSREREVFFQKIEKLATKLISYLPIDEAVDMHAKDFIHSCLPPCWSIKEKKNSVHGNSFSWKDGVICTSPLQLDSRIRLLRKRIFRLVVEDSCVRLYHTIGNSTDYKELEAKYVEGDADIVPAIQFLMRSYPEFIQVDELPMENTSKLLFANDMYNNGFLMTEEPLEKILG